MLVELLNNGASTGKEINAKKTVKDGEGKGTFQKLRVFHYMHVLISRDKENHEPVNRFCDQNWERPSATYSHMITSANPLRYTRYTTFELQSTIFLPSGRLPC